MIWASNDPAASMGWAFWVDNRLDSTAVLKKVGAKGKYRLGEQVLNSRVDAYELALLGLEVLVIEEGCGKFTTAVKSQAVKRGHLEILCEQSTSDGNPLRFEVINVSEWRRAIKDAYGISWPAGRDRLKERSIALVKKHFGIDVTDDESDAVLIGVAAMRLGIVDFANTEGK